MSDKALTIERPALIGPGEGWLYANGDHFYLVYTGASRAGWDACVSDDDASFSRVLVKGATRDECARALADALGLSLR